MDRENRRGVEGPGLRVKRLLCSYRADTRADADLANAREEPGGESGRRFSGRMTRKEVLRHLSGVEEVAPGRLSVPGLL